MAKVIQSWHCETCATPFDTMQAAEWCEKRHTDWRELKLTHGSYSQVKSDFFNRGEQHGLPDSLQVTWMDKNNREQYAFYRLYQIGPTPV